MAKPDSGMEIQCLGEHGNVLWHRNVNGIRRDTALFLSSTLNGLHAEAVLNAAGKRRRMPTFDGQVIGGYTLVED